MRLPTLGEDFGRYRLERELGRGGMGIVYAARDTALDREVALKLITPQWAEDPEYRARFEREALSLSRVESSHVVGVHDYGELDGCLYLVTQVVPDGDLLQLVRREGTLAPAVALDVVGQVLDGLSDAHGVGVVHRDVKPSNVLLRRREGRLEAVLCDFGIATSPGGDVTRTGALVGSFPYMAPERHQGEQADGAADVYSVGCVLWQTFTGTAPYVGSDVEVAMAHLQAPLPQLPGTDDFSVALNLVLARALAKSPAERYPSARAMRADLRSVAALAPGSLELPETTAVRHVIVPGVVAAQAATGPDAAHAAPGRPPTRTRRPVLSIAAAMLAVVLAVGGTYAVVAAATDDPDGATRSVGTAIDVPPEVTGGLPSSPGATEEPGSPKRTTGSSSRKGAKAGSGRPRTGTSSTRGDSGSGVLADPGGEPGPLVSGGTGTGSSGGSTSSGAKGRGTKSDGTKDGGTKDGAGGRGASSSAEPTPAPTPTPRPTTFRCWDGVTETYGYSECPALSGVAGVKWVYPGHYGCTEDPTSGGPRLVILTCPRKTKHGSGEIRYTLWRSVADAVDYFSGQNGSKSRPWRDDWGYTWFRETPTTGTKFQRTNVYAGEPVSVVVRAVNIEAQQQIEGIVQYRIPGNLRGEPK